MIAGFNILKFLLINLLRIWQKHLGHAQMFILKKRFLQKGQQIKGHLEISEVIIKSFLSPFF